MQAVTGGRGDDVIIGDDNANHLDGAEGRDRLVGLGGDDILSNTYVWRRSGDDVLDAGPGNDQLNGAASASQLRCGPGEDSVSASVGNLVGRDCELVGSDSWPKTRLRATVSNATTVFLGSLPYCQDCSSDRWRVEARGRVVASVSARTQPADLRLNATGRRLLRRYRALTLRVERRFVLPPRTTRSMSGFTTTIRLR
jgi:Ca2+-binding RTX toxin-like protein